MPADPKIWTLLDRIRQNLASITAGANYNYTPHRVAIVRGGDGVWPTGQLDPSLGAGAGDPPTIYLIRRGQRRFGRKSTGDVVNGPRDQAMASIDVQVNQMSAPSSPADTPTEALVVERMCADVIRKLAYEDPGLGAVIDADDVLAADDAVFDDSAITSVPWIQAQLTFQVTYDYYSTAP